MITFEHKQVCDSFWRMSQIAEWRAGYERKARVGNREIDKKLLQ